MGERDHAYPFYVEAPIRTERHEMSTRLDDKRCQFFLSDLIDRVSTRCCKTQQGMERLRETDRSQRNRWLPVFLDTGQKSKN